MFGCAIVSQTASYRGYYFFADLHHLLRVALPDRARLDDFLDQRELGLKPLYADFLFGALKLVGLLYGFSQRGPSLLVVAVLVDLDLRAGIEEARELVEGLRLVVEADDVLHKVRALVSVRVLKVVAGKDEDFGHSRVHCEVYHLLSVALLDQALHCLLLLP